MARILGLLLALCGLIASAASSAGAAGTGLTIDPCAQLHNSVTYKLLGVNAKRATRVHFTPEPGAAGWASCSAALSRSSRSISLALTQTAAPKLHYEYKQRACTTDACVKATELAMANASATHDFYCYQFPRLKKVRPRGIPIGRHRLCDHLRQRRRGEERTRSARCARL